MRELAEARFFSWNLVAEVAYQLFYLDQPSRVRLGRNNDAFDQRLEIHALAKSGQYVGRRPSQGLAVKLVVDVDVPVDSRPLRFPDQRPNLTLVRERRPLGCDETQYVPSDMVKAVANQPQHRPVGHGIERRLQQAIARADRDAVPAKLSPHSRRLVVKAVPAGDEI